METAQERNPNAKIRIIYERRNKMIDFFAIYGEYGQELIRAIENLVEK